ncbi:heavy metal-responsive transcriptional regulator [Mycobacterium paraintracellulare]|uniref:heavy metal-responsive transcriptional regulator n=1 Tax=Mycobacterium paraintracellulare TaxID=1138383 RepID=UPI00191564C5|nr:heavy metal-responsive transcriptional regulator [Mycobacterium paraintracellulare]
MTHPMTIGAAARATGVTAKAIRLYEQRGLLRPADRTAAGYRLFDSTVIDTLQFIRRARSLGLCLDDIADILAIHRTRTTPCAAVDHLIDQRVADIDATIADLQHLRDTLLTARRRPNTAAAICPIIESRD